MQIPLLRHCLCIAALTLAASASQAYTLSANGGDGHLSGSYPKFTLTGSDDGSGLGIYTTYAELFSQDQVVSFNWSYLTRDAGGSSFDTAGWLLNGDDHQLTQDGQSGAQQGTAVVHVSAGDTFGWYVRSFDSDDGSADLTVNALAAVPEPATFALLTMGLSVVFWVRRRT